MAQLSLLTDVHALVALISVLIHAAFMPQLAAQL
jgi:hypothetical protein